MPAQEGRQRQEARAAKARRVRALLRVIALIHCSNRYRDLIESADSIVDMKRSADGLVTSISRMDEESGRLSRKGPSGTTSRSPQASEKDAERAARKLVRISFESVSW